MESWFADKGNDNDNEQRRCHRIANNSNLLWARNRATSFCYCCCWLLDILLLGCSFFCISLNGIFHSFALIKAKEIEKRKKWKDTRKNGRARFDVLLLLLHHLSTAHSAQRGKWTCAQRAFTFKNSSVLCIQMRCVCNSLTNRDDDDDDGCTYAKHLKASGFCMSPDWHWEELRQTKYCEFAAHMCIEQRMNAVAAAAAACINCVELRCEIRDIINLWIILINWFLTAMDRWHRSRAIIKIETIGR